MTEARIDDLPAARPDVAGAVTFLFTDVEGSTRLWEASPDTMRTALRRHDELLRVAITGGGGQVVKTTGDGLMAVFGSAGAGVGAAIAAQLAIGAEAWEEPCRIRVRMGLHTGEAEVRGGDYFGRSVNRTARIMAAGHGGQVLVSSSTAALAADDLAPGVTLRDLGEHRLKDLDRPERLFQVLHPDLRADFPALGTVDLRATNLPALASEFVGREGGARSDPRAPGGRRRPAADPHRTRRLGQDPAGAAGGRGPAGPIRRRHLLRGPLDGARRRRRGRPDRRRDRPRRRP